jgi:NAD(P)-dependent dehydrogenase (short-subunit alcohol dehydrogenase family)
MTKTILITGSTDGIGLETARALVSLGHHVLLHGRNPKKLDAAERELSALPGGGEVESFAADLSDLAQVEALADAVTDAVTAKQARLDVLINNAGVFAVPEPITGDGLDVRFVVNTIAPYVLTRRLLPLLEPSGRVVNLSSAAQSPVDLRALAGELRLSDGPAYAQSKLALTMWSRSMAHDIGDEGPAVIAVNPGSMLGTKMVKQAYGVAGADVGVGAEILRRAALDDDFAKASGSYFDNDSGRFADPHPDALDPRKCAEVVAGVEAVLNRQR